MEYDICIIGAGISGLYCARELSKKLPDAKICILEKYEFLGGRVSTFKQNVPGVGRIQWEAGAGRIHTSHTETIQLLKEYKIDTIPIPGMIQWRSEESSIPETIDFGRYIDNLALSQISPDSLAKSTIKLILEKTLGKNETISLMDTYEYNSELDTLRADKALESIHKELGKHNGFFIVKGGFSSLIGALKRDVQKARVHILRNKEMKNIHRIPNGYSVTIKNEIPIQAKKILLTIPRDALAKIPCFKNLQILKQVTMRPLVRMYAVFPLINGISWFKDIQKFVCPPPVRFVIPMDPLKGTIMISYTDGEDAEYWIHRMKDGNQSIIDEIMKQIRGLFPSILIPAPLYFKIHSWSDGCSYWTPGNYKVDKVSYASLIPLPKEMPNVYMANESWAENQCWVNSAIQQSNHAIKTMLDQ
jgi:monoamine oxidase